MLGTLQHSGRRRWKGEKREEGDAVAGYSPPAIVARAVPFRAGVEAMDAALTMGDEHCWRHIRGQDAALRMLLPLDAQCMYLG